MARRILVLALIALALWLAAPLQATGAAPFVFQTDMFGSNQVPPVTTQAYGFVRFFFSEDRLEADYTVDVKGISGSIVEGADIHKGAPGTNGPVIKHLADGGFIVTSGHLRLTAAELEEMAGGAWYVSLKTKAHPDGEMRGQVIVPAGFLPSPPQTADPTPTLTAAPLPSSALPASGAGVGVRPPSTGDAGLIGEGAEPVRAVMVGLAAVIFGVALMFASRASRD